MTALVEVRERPIPFTAEMVRKLLKDEKSQTRRVMKVQPTPPVGYACVTSDGHALFFQGTTVESPPCDLDHKIPKSPYGIKGDRLWVKETYTTNAFGEKLYRADFEDFETKGMGWKSGRFMRKEYARIWLEVTDVRVERLQRISAQDCEAEGVPAEYHGQKSMGIAWKDYEGEVHQIYGIEAMFAGIWTSINDKRPGCRWVDNPMVWAYSFRKIER
jgi:hypothetical protein